MKHTIYIQQVCLRLAIGWAIVQVPSIITAQNTIGGIRREVSEKEIARQSLFLDAESQRMLGKYDAAVTVYKKFLYDNPDNAAAWYGLARCYEEMKGFGSSLDAISKAIEYDGNNKWYYIHQADLLERAGQVKGAVKVYETMTKKFPETAEFYEKLAYLYVLTGEPQDGIKALDKLEKLKGVSEVTTSKKHLIYVGANDNKRAAFELQRLIDAYPTRLDYRKRLAVFYTEIGDVASARATYEQIQRMHPDDPDAKLALATKEKNKSNKAGYLEGLLPVFKDPGVSIDAKIKEIAPFLSEIEQGKDLQLQTNALALGAALEVAHPDDPKTWSLSGDLFYLCNRTDEALQRYQKCIQLRPKAFSVYDNALSIMESKQQYKEMATLADKALDAFPNQPKAYYWYGLVANAQQRPDDAIAQLEQGLLMAANKTDLLLDLSDQIGIALYQKRDFSAAAIRYEQVLPKGGDRHPGILEHYGDVLTAKGDRAKGLEYWKKAYALRKTPALEQKISGR